MMEFEIAVLVLLFCPQLMSCGAIPGGYWRSYDMFFKSGRRKLHYQAAFNDCKKDHAVVQRMKNGKASNGLLGNFWLGLNYDGKKFTWSDGAPLTVTNWDSGEPDVTSGKKCVFSDRLQWRMSTCSVPRFYRCEFKNFVTKVTRIPPDQVVTTGTNVSLQCKISDDNTTVEHGLTYTFYIGENPEKIQNSDTTVFRPTSPGETKLSCGVEQFGRKFLGADGTVSVVAQPELSATPQGPIFGWSKLNVTLTCTINKGLQAIGYEFYHDKELVLNSSNNHMELKSAKFIDSGTYTCKAISTTGFWFESNVLNFFIYDKPTLTTNPPEGEITPGSKIVMTCTLPDKKPSVVYTFFHDNKVVQQSSSNKYVLRDAGFNLSGDYLCTARLEDIRSLESEKRTIMILGCPMSSPNSDYTRRLLGSITPREETTRWGGHKRDKKNVHGDL